MRNRIRQYLESIMAKRKPRRRDATTQVKFWLTCGSTTQTLWAGTTPPELMERDDGIKEWREPMEDEYIHPRKINWCRKLMIQKEFCLTYTIEIGEIQEVTDSVAFFLTK